MCPPGPSVLPGAAEGPAWGFLLSFTALLKEVKRGQRKCFCLSESRIKIWGLQADFLSFGDLCQSGGMANYSINH